MTSLGGGVGQFGRGSWPVWEGGVDQFRRGGGGGGGFPAPPSLDETLMYCMCNSLSGVAHMATEIFVPFWLNHECGQAVAYKLLIVRVHVQYLWLGGYSTTKNGKHFAKLVPPKHILPNSISVCVPIVVTAPITLDSIISWSCYSSVDSDR